MNPEDGLNYSIDLCVADNGRVYMSVDHMNMIECKLERLVEKEYSSLYVAKDVAFKTVAKHRKKICNREP